MSSGIDAENSEIKHGADSYLYKPQLSTEELRRVLKLE
jgi:hypothetical protein